MIIGGILITMEPADGAVGSRIGAASTETGCSVPGLVGDSCASMGKDRHSGIIGNGRSECQVL